MEVDILEKTLVVRAGEVAEQGYLFKESKRWIRREEEQQSGKETTVLHKLFWKTLKLDVSRKGS